MNNLDQMHLADEIERKIEQESEIIQESLKVIIEAAETNIPNIPTMKTKDIVEQLEWIRDFLANAEAANQRRMTWKQVLDKLNEIV